MKYTFQCSEQELTAAYNLIGQIVQEVGRTIRHSNELRLALVKSNPHVTVPPAANEEGADVIEFPREVPKRKTEEEVEDNLSHETEAAPRPAASAPPAAEQALASSKVKKRLARGRKAFDTFVQDWLVGIDMDTMMPIEGAVQPARDQMLRDLQNGRDSYAVLLYVKSCGGLQCAIADVTGSQDLALALASYIVPPASIAFSDLADTYEYHNPFRKDDDE